MTRKSISHLWQIRAWANFGCKGYEFFCCRREHASCLDWTSHRKSESAGFISW